MPAIVPGRPGPVNGSVPLPNAGRESVRKVGPAKRSLTWAANTENEYVRLGHFKDDAIGSAATSFEQRFSSLRRTRCDSAASGKLSGDSPILSIVRRNARYQEIEPRTDRGRSN